MYDLIKHQLSPSHSVLVPEITISGGKEVTNLDQLHQTTVPSKLRLKRAAIIKNNKLVGWMSENEALGISFLRDKVNYSNISFACNPEKSAAKDSNYMVSRSKAKIPLTKRKVNMR
jgi:spore germination protein KC